MEPFGIGIAGLGIAGLSTFGAFGLAFRSRRRRLLKASAAAAPAPAPRSAADRLEALGAAQAELALRVDAIAAEARGPEERLQAMAGQLLGLIRDKNATLETALAGLDQLRSRMRTLEQMGAPAEARSLYDGLAARLDALGTAQAALEAAVEARLAAADPTDAAALARQLAEQIAGLEEKRAAGVEAMLGRLAPVESRLAAAEQAREAEGAAARELLKRLEARVEAGLEARTTEAGATRTELAALRAEAGAARALGEQLGRLLAQKDGLAETLVTRLAALESDLVARDPGPAIELIDARLAAIEEGNPFAEVSDQLTRLYAQKDATVERMLARLAPLEARLAELDPQAALDRFAERLEAVQGRVAVIESAGNPFAEVSEQLTALYAQKDATVETVFARLAPLEARLEEIGRGLDRVAPLAEDDPRAALDGLRVRLEALHWAQGETAAGLAALRAAAGERAAGEGTLSEIADRLTRLYAQKDAALAAVIDRLGPLEARLATVEAGAPAAEAVAETAAEALAAARAASGMIAARAAEDATALFADRIAALEARLPRARIAGFSEETGLEAILALPRVVSLHRQ